MRFDPIGILQVLADHDVEFIVIGGIAAGAQGSPSATVDIDICYARTETNLERLAAALRALDARLRGVDDDVPFLLGAATLRAGDHFTLTTLLGDLDLLGIPAGTSGYDDLVAGATEVEIDQMKVWMASVDDLIHMKRAAGRPKDRVELEILHALRDELEP